MTPRLTLATFLLAYLMIFPWVSLTATIYSYVAGNKDFVSLQVKQYFVMLRKLNDVKINRRQSVQKYKIIISRD